MSENKDLEWTDWTKTLGLQLVKEIKLEIPSNPPIIHIQKTCTKCKNIFSYKNSDEHEILVRKIYFRKSVNLDLCINCEESK